MPDDQSQTLALLADPATYSNPDGGVRRIDTHISAVFLAGDRAYKLKRAVKFPYLDFSTANSRRKACEAELSVNRRTAPDLYLAVRPIVRDGDRLRLGNVGESGVDWVVEMRRFPDNGIWDLRIAAGTISAGDIRALADAVAEFHDGAQATPEHGSAADLIWTADGNNIDLVRIFPREQVENLDRETRAEIIRHAALIARRSAQGSVRRCHGDLHLRNIATFDGRPLLFDAIEFDDRISCIDTLFDLAFLVVDLLRVGRRDFACQLLSRYFGRRPDEEGLALLPLFLGLRAAIKAKTRAAAGAAQEAQACFAMADRFLHPPPARLVAVGGLSGTGKTALCMALAEELGAAPGALVLRSDVERKRLAGIAPEIPLPKSAYTPQASRAVYASLHARAASALAAGHSVVLDAVYSDLGERLAAAEMASACGIRLDGLWLECPEEIRLSRVAARRGDASDADGDIVREQSARRCVAKEWQEIDASRMPSDTLDAARAWLRRG
ncbi:MAG: AAA family ATPase [Alphaproteobacteria bacterium]|nr:AAA family ATPase [Alphaproteobacteria bacterium]